MAVPPVMSTPARVLRLWANGLRLTVTLPKPASLMLAGRVVRNKLTVPPPVPILICIESYVGLAKLTPFTVVLSPLSSTSTVFTELSQVTVRTRLTTLMVQDGVTRGSNSSRRSGDRGQGSAGV